MVPSFKRSRKQFARPKKDGLEPWGLTKAGKNELEEIAARKAAEKYPSKGDTTLFMGELEQGLDENAE
jgi:hypothetical protein